MGLRKNVCRVLCLVCVFVSAALAAPPVTGQKTVVPHTVEVRPVSKSMLYNYLDAHKKVYEVDETGGIVVLYQDYMVRFTFPEGDEALAVISCTRDDFPKKHLEKLNDFCGEWNKDHFHPCAYVETNDGGKNFALYATMYFDYSAGVFVEGFNNDMDRVLMVLAVFYDEVAGLSAETSQ